jgi:hypothetical protein
MANSARVSNISGAELTNSPIAFSTYAVVAICDEPDAVGTPPNLTLSCIELDLIRIIGMIYLLF